MKLVYLTLEAPREGQASYVHVHEIIEGLRRQDVGVTLYEPSYTHRPASPALMVRLLLAIWLQVKLWCQWSRGSVLYVRGHYLAYPSAVIARMLGIPVIQEINGRYEDVFVTYPQLAVVKWPLIFLQRWQYKAATGLITVTDELRKWANQEGQRDDCVLISNGANTDVFTPNLPRPADIPDHYVLFFGGLTRWHGVPTMLRAVHESEWPKSVKLVIIGDGQEANSVQKETKKTNNILYLGRKPYREIAPYIANALAGVVMISNPDNRSSTGVLPLKLFETLACGVPAIVSDLPGQADLIRDHKCGVVVPCDDAQGLAQAVQSLHRNSQTAMKMGVIGREITVQQHSWFARSQTTLGFLRGLVDKD